MPKPPEVVVDDKKVDDKQVQIQLDDNNQPVKPVEPAKDEPKYVRLEDIERVSKAVENTRQYTTRQISSINEKLDKFLQATAPKAPEPQPPADEWEAKLQKDWRGTVEELSERKARELYQKLRAEEMEQAKVQAEEYRNHQLRESNKQKVMERHKELNDENSMKAQVFREVIQEHPEYLPNPFGPVLAMRDMEDRLRERGIVDEPTRQVVDKEVARQVRTSGGVAPRGTVNAPSNKVVLTKEEKEFCDQQGLKYEIYARNKKLTSANSGVEA